MEIQPEHELFYRDGTSIKPINSGDALDETIIGLTTPAAGHFSQLSASINEETLSSNKTLTISDHITQWLDPNGSDRDIILPAEASSTNLMFIILNTANGASEDLVIKNDGTSTIITIGPGQSALLSCDGTNWKLENDNGIYYDSISNAIKTSSIDAISSYYPLINIEGKTSSDLPVVRLTSSKTAGAACAFEWFNKRASGNSISFYQDMDGNLNFERGDLNASGVISNKRTLFKLAERIHSGDYLPLISNNFANNVVVIQQLHANGFSAIRFDDKDDNETSAIGYGNTSSSGPFTNRVYWETSGISAGAPPKDMIIVTTVLNVRHKRMNFDTNENIYIYNWETGGTGVDLNETPMVTFLGTGETGFGTETPNTTVDIQGGQTAKVTTINTATYDLLITDYILNVTYTSIAAVTSLTLPTAQSVKGRVIIIKDAGYNAGTNNITIDTEGAEKINNADTYIINNNGGSVNIYSDGTDWYVI